MEEEFGVDSSGGNKAIYLGMKMEKIDTPEFKGATLDPNNYGGKINHIAIPKIELKKR